MNEEIKDPNQIDMFAGILFTPEQEQKIAEFIKIREDIANTNESINKQREQLLTNNGFIKDVDFVNTFKIETVTNETTIGYSYNKTDFKAEITYKTIDGSIFLKGKRFGTYSNPNELINSTFNIDFEEDKVNCSTIQDNYRYIKPATLLEKLKTFDSRQKQLLEEYKRKNGLKLSTVEKYTKLYPNATITVKSDWGDVIEVKFESGSYVQFKLDTYKNVEYLYKKHDAEIETLGLDKLLDKFSKQEALK